MKITDRQVRPASNHLTLKQCGLQNNTTQVSLCIGCQSVIPKLRKELEQFRLRCLQLEKYINQCKIQESLKEDVKVYGIAPRELELVELRKENQGLKRLVRSIEEDNVEKRDFGEYLLRQNQQMNRQFFNQLAIKKQSLEDKMKHQRKQSLRKSLGQIKIIIRNFSASQLPK